LPAVFLLALVGSRRRVIATRLVVAVCVCAFVRQRSGLHLLTARCSLDADVTTAETPVVFVRRGCIVVVPKSTPKAAAVVIIVTSLVSATRSILIAS
jgi:poly(3-hydroxybutyrate) depolymerase